MASYIKGNPVANATSYELFEKSGSIYTSLKTGSEINFNLDELTLAGGNHTLVVKAKADGYEDSDYSNEVVYFVENGVRNLFNKDSDEIRYGELCLHGEWTTNYATGRATSHYIPCTAGQQFALYSKSIVTFWTKDKVWVTEENPQGATKPRVMTVPDDSSIAYFQFVYVVDEEPIVMCVEGTEYPDNYIPYVG